MKKGILIINLGTPKKTSFYEVARFLSAFLTDKRVIDLPAFFRYLLVYGFIVPFRTQSTAKAYKHIWTKDGSPLLQHMLSLKAALQSAYQGEAQVELGMRYGEPSIKSALDRLKDCEQLTLLPLYPQYASASTGSSLEASLRALAKQNYIPSVTSVHSFHQHPSFISAQAESIAPLIPEHDFLLFSYHGIPERQVLKGGCPQLCQGICTKPTQRCYRSNCFETSSLIAQTLKLSQTSHATAFQSRVGRMPWTQPYTDEVLAKLKHQGIKRLLVACPSFTADCLETIEEIQIRLKAQWLAMGGETLTLVPSLNASPAWINAIKAIIQDAQG